VSGVAEYQYYTREKGVCGLSDSVLLTVVLFIYLFFFSPVTDTMQLTDLLQAFYSHFPQLFETHHRLIVVL
jgi:hypothetical protein